jgi:hypothetical protein
MPTNSQPVLIRNTEALLEAADRTPEVQPDVERLRLAVVQELGEVKTLKARQEELTAQKQEVTQKLRAAIERLEDVSIIFRAVVKGKLGPRNERLVQFKVAPLRRRSRSKAAALVKLPDGKASDTKPDTSVSPPAKPVD